MADDVQQSGGAVEAEDINALNAVNEDGEPVPVDPYDLTNDEVRRKISSRIDKRLAVDRTSRATFERGWFRNLSFKVGQQQIIFDNGKFRLRKTPAWFPKAQTNKFGEKARDLKAAILQGRVPIKYNPATDDPKDQWGVDIGERVRDVIYAEAKIDDREEELAAWFIDTGNAFIIPYYDYDDKHGMVENPKLGCAACGASYGAADMDARGIDADDPMCPECAVNPPWPMFNEAAGGMLPPPPTNLLPTNEVEMLPIGALCADFCSPFEIRCDYRIRDYREWTWYIRQRRYDQKFAEDKWKKKFTDSQRSEDGDTNAQHYLDVLATITDVFNPAQSLGSSAGTKSPKVTAYIHSELPDDDFPEGLRAVRIGSGDENVVEAGPLPTEYGSGVRKGQKFLNIIHLCAEKIPGRLWGKTPLDDAIPLQIFRNIVEANIRLTVQRMGNGIWLLPKGCGVENLTGEPGQQVGYNPVTLGGTTIAKPERVPAELNNLGALLELLKFIDDQIERVTGTYFLQGGEAPAGVTAASALALLDERAKKAMSPLMREWAKGFLAFDQQALEIARQNWTDTRIRVIAGRNKKFQTAAFMNSDLQGGVNMEIDYQSMFPKNNATLRAEIAQLIEGSVINPQDEQQKYQILKAYGLLKLLGSVDLDIEQAQKEWEQFLLYCRTEGTEGKLPVIKPLNNNSVVHFAEHCDVSKTDEYDELPPDQQALWDAHIQAHAGDIGARRAFFAAAQIDPDAPQGAEIGSAAAQAAMGGASQASASMQPPGASEQGNPGTLPGSRNGNNGPRPPGTNGQEAAKMAQLTGAAAGDPSELVNRIHPATPPPPPQ